MTPERLRQIQFYFYSRIWDFWLNFKFLCTVFLWVYPCTWHCLSKSWLDHLCLLGVTCMLWMHIYIMYAFVRMKTRSQKKCTTTNSSSLPQNISYNSSWDYQLCQYLPFYYCIFWCISCVGISFFNLTRLNTEALFQLYDSLQLFWNHTDAVYRRSIIQTSFNQVGKFWIPLHNWFLWCSPDLNMCLLWIQLLLCNAWKDASHSFPCNTISQ